jgi:hypothetical protein
MGHLTEREGWLVLIAPFSSAIVWAGGVIAGNLGWFSGWSTTAPVGATFTMTLCTTILYLLSLPVLLRLLKHWRANGKQVGSRLVLSGLAAGSVWGGFLKTLGPAYLIAGPACGLVIGLFLASTLGTTRRDIGSPPAHGEPPNRH